MLAGQVRDEDEKPLAGVTIKLGGSSPTTLGTTDAAGNFLVPVAMAGPQVFLIDGSTANTPSVSYASIPVTVTIQPTVANSLGFVPHLHAQPVTRSLPVAPSGPTPVTFATLPDFQVTIPAGVQIIGWDGQPNTQIGVRAVPLDRLAVPPLPAGVETTTVYMFSFGKVGGGKPSQPIPVTAPNTIGAYPGQQVELWYFNEAPDGTAPNRWEMFGYGTVSSDGKLIVSNPGVGIPRFCCGAWFSRVPATPQNRPGPETPPQPGPEKCPKCGGPIDLASGLLTVEATDFRITGRLPLVLTRTYRTLDPTVGPFGVGWRHTYEYFVRAVSPDMALLITPENLRPWFAKQPDGTFANTDIPTYRGARLTKNGDNTWTLRFKDGTTWTFNTSGWLTAQRDRNGNTLTITRDSQNRTSSLTDPAGRSLTFSYSGTGLTVQQVTDPTGRSVSYTYDANDRLSLVTDPLGQVTRYNYDIEGRLATLTDPRGTVTERNTYDSAGRVIRQVQADGGTFQIAYQVTAGTITGVTETDSNGNKLTFRFGTGRVLTEATDALGQRTQTPRASGSNLVTSRTDALGRTTQYTYDGTGNVLTLTDPLGQVRTFTYDPSFNQVLTSTDPLNQTTTYSYDNNGNLTSITDPLNHTTTFGYNATGDLTSVTDALNHTTTFEYDSVGNLVATVDPLGNRTERTYDSFSRLIMVKDPNGAMTRFAYDVLDRLVSITDPLGGTTQFSYDPNGNLLTVTDAKGQTTFHTYDPMNRLASRTDALNRTESYTYDFNGNLKTLTDRKNQVTTHTYDAENRRVRTDYADGSSVSFAYDPTGNLVTATDSLSGSLTRSYDALNRLVREVTPQGAITYAYDQVSRRQTMQANGLQPVAYGYDGASRLTGITQGPQAVALTYDPSNRRTSLVLPNGITVEYQYDLGSRLTALTYTGPQGVLGDLTYTYDANGNRIGTGGSWARSGIPGSIGTSSYDAANQQLAFGDIAQTFDPNGNLLTQTEASGTTTYTWDARNRLVAINGPSVSAAFAYDALGRRISKTINGQTTTFHYDGVDIVRESGAGGEASYLRMLAIDEALSRADASGTFAYLADVLGSTVALVDGTGAVPTSYTYEPFGKSSLSGASSSNPFQFTGRENDGSGPHYYRARYYAATLARFLNEDPFRFGIGESLYKYVRNNPLKWKDPMGLIEWPFEAPMPWNEGTETMSPLLPSALVPTYGNWGGPGWSGGKWGGEVGPNPPVDSMDECFKAHDECYGQRPCYASERTKRRSCDKELIDCLGRLPEDPRMWPNPSPAPEFVNSYRQWATRWFRWRSR
jgi:RHS repeat-associated protein